MEDIRGKLLYHLEKNSRYTSHDLSIITGLPHDEIDREITLMTNERVICGFNTLINWDKTDKDFVTALIEVKVTPQRGQGFDKFAERIYAYEEVKAVYLMSGGFDITVIVEGKNIREVAYFVSDKLAPLESVISTATHFVLKKYKEHGIILEHISEDERMIVSP